MTLNRLFVPAGRFLLRFFALALVISSPVLGFAQGSEDPCQTGEQLFRAGDFEKARIDLQLCLDAGQESTDILLPLTVMAIRTGRKEEAVGYSGRAKAIDPQNVEALYWHGRALLEVGRFQEARLEWESGLGIAADHLGILEGLAKLAAADGEMAKAYNILTQLQRSGMDEPWVHRLMADITAGKGLWNQTLVHLNDLMVMEEPDLDLLMLATEISLVAEDMDGALDLGRRAILLQPGAASYGAIGEVFFARDETDSALVYLRKAVELDSEAHRVRFNLANVLEVMGLVEEADGHFRAFLLAEPNDPIGQFNFGIHLQKMGRLEEALEHVSLSVILDPSLLSARVVRIQMLEILGRYDEALRDIAYLRESDPESQSELSEWERKIRLSRESLVAAHHEGQFHLLHLVVEGSDVWKVVLQELAEGKDFSSLVVRFSMGPAAAKGGDIGWIDPEDMVEPMRSAIMGLGVNEISPPVETGGLYHIFKRIP
ncbi:MAG: peptidylprolyl isomerase [Gemmatimonadales bacterium]|nr:peptidylprolyl isomerase [Gemmatimonadales bacterium]